ncbi:MAG: pilin, partial [Candidatus Magasanikbacteria bacterium]|nr:pilin [Candidatus Magasanikbacteria bacterium]
LVPTMGLAADSTIDPEFNTICWKQEDCNKSRAEILGKDPGAFKGSKDGWLEKEDPCNKAGWGKCLPVGLTKTTISFGGKKSFENIGEFIKYNYNLGLSIAGILAVIMVVVAGIQWVTSGGNSEMISSAKKRIGGAMIGLLIAYLSYTILNTVNPALVNLRLPSVFLIRPFKETPEFCRDAPNQDATFALAAPNGGAVDPKVFQSGGVQFDKSKKDFDTMGCGSKYFISGSGGSTCKGDKCTNEGESCLPFYFVGDLVDNSKSSCIKADVVIHFSIDPTIMGTINDKLSWWTSTLESEWLDDSADFWGVCQTEDGKKYIGKKEESWSSPQLSIKKVNGKNFNDYYMIVAGLDPNKPGNEKEDFWECDTENVKGKLVGFVLKAEMKKTSIAFGGIDNNFYPSPNFVGRWKSISENGYIPLGKIKSGLYFNAPIGTDEADYLSESVANGVKIPAALHYEGIDGEQACVEKGCSDDGFMPTGG